MWYDDTYVCRYDRQIQKELTKEAGGMMTHMCVDTTVRAAKDLGHLVTLISDACATKDLEWNGRKLPASLINDVYMASLNGKFATVMSSTDYLL